VASNKSLTLSLVIPAYNEENHLRACLDAIAIQTVMPDEVIVVDNNSVDKTAQIARRYPFVTVLKEARQGIAYARDTGFNTARSRLIGRIDADTVLPADWIAQIKDFYRQPGHADKAFTGGCYFYNLRFPHFTGWWQGQIAFRANRLLLGHYILFGSNMAMPKKLWQKVKKDVCHDPHIHEDLDLAIHIHRQGYTVVYHEPLQVGIKMRRVFEDRDQLWENMLWWPRTLRRHGLKSWILGWLGAVLLYACSFLLWIIFRKTSSPVG